MTHLEDYMPRIRAMHPELHIQSVHMATTGGANNTIIVASDDGNWIFRFAKTDASRAGYRTELALLDALKPHLELPIPQPVIREPDVMAYRMLEGVPLTHWLLASLDSALQQRLADQLGAFLRTLHSMPREAVPLHRPAKTGNNFDFGPFYARVQERLYPSFDPHQREWVDRLFADGAGLYDNLPPDEASCLIYNDFKVAHVLYDPKTQRLSGIIDFGQACFDPPDIDICNAMQCFGETFVLRMLNTYPEARALLPRARFGVHVMDLEAIYDGWVGNNLHRLVSNVAVPRDVAFPIF
jgi:aminoglycoside 2''-phosphotransferase